MGMAGNLMSDRSGFARTTVPSRLGIIANRTRGPGTLKGGSPPRDSRIA